MGITKSIAYMVIGTAIFYGGMSYERKHCQKEIAELKEQVVQMDSIDYKVSSLLEDRSRNPAAVDDVLKKYETLVR